jgi:hypothetical protein
MELTKENLKKMIKEEVQALYSEELTDTEKKEKEKAEKTLDKLKHK